MNKQVLTIEELIKATRVYLESLNYAKDSLRHMNNCWKTLLGYAKTENVMHFTTEFGHRFLKERYNIDPFSKASSSHKRTVRRAVTILADYQLNGFIHKRQPTRLHVWAEGYYDICTAFMKSIAKTHAESSQRQHRAHLEKLTEYMNEHGVNSIGEVSALNIDGYFTTFIGYSKRSVSYACNVVKMFFKFALENEYVETDLSVHVPAVKVNYRSNLPSVFTHDEISKLLAAVDRHNPCGKRDYAILLLAVRYGMRVGEITALKLSNLDFESKKINYTQSKTNNAVSVDMLEGVGWALIDYLKNARPTTDSPNVFIRMVAPFDAFGKSNNLNSLVRKYMSRAGIKQTSGRHYGMHTIRHSLASHLLEQGNPIHAVSAVLEHLELNSTMIYTKVDLPQLSLCALEVPDACV